MTEQKITLPKSVKTSKAKCKSSVLKRFAFDNIVTIVFVVLCFFGILLAKQPVVFLNKRTCRLKRPKLIYGSFADYYCFGWYGT